MAEREDIIRSNIARYEKLLLEEKDAERRCTVGLLLIEARAELDFLVESRAIAGSAGEAATATARLLDKARKYRVSAGNCGHRPTREVLLRIAADFERLALELESQDAETPRKRDDDR